jgi:hypothetical protein
MPESLSFESRVLRLESTEKISAIGRNDRKTVPPAALASRGRQSGTRILDTPRNHGVLVLNWWHKLCVENSVHANITITKAEEHHA